LVDRYVNTFYVVPGVGSQIIYRSLIGYEKLIIGSGSDFQEEYRDNWVVSLEYDLVSTLIETWPTFISTETGFIESPPLLLTDINYDLLSEGKVKQVYKILEELRAGFINTSFVVTLKKPDPLKSPVFLIITNYPLPDRQIPGF